MVGFALNTLGGNLRHSHVWLRYPRRLEHILISPAQHQIHHSATAERCHSNLGSWLAIWDWMGGSLRFRTERRPVRFGLPRSELNHAPHQLVSALLMPMRASAQRLVPFGRKTAPDPAFTGRRRRRMPTSIGQENPQMSQITQMRRHRKCV